MLKILAVTSILLASALSVRLGGDTEAEVVSGLMATLTDPAEYNAAIRPSVNGGPTQVKLSSYIRNIDIDDERMEANIDLTFRMRWQDPRLAYRSNRIPFVILLNPHLAWLPDAFFKQAITTQMKSVYPENYLRVYDDGTLVYSTRLILKQRCPMNLARFPHDSQVCNIIIASYGFTTDQVNFNSSVNDVQVGKDIFVKKFTLTGYDTEFLTSATSTGTYSSFQISLMLQRMFSSYMCEWYIPVMMFLVVAWSSFFVPGDQFLARLLLTLLPLITMSSVVASFRMSLASVNYVRALDIFSGFSVTFSFAALINIIVCYIRRSASDDSALDTRGGRCGKAVIMNYLPAIIHAASYLFFLIIYFSVFSFGG